MATTQADVRTALQEERQQLLEGLAEEEEHDLGRSDIADAATGRIEQFTDDRERRRRQDRVAQIEAALQRLEEGTWGRCSDCGGEIAKARMKALPTAEQCVDCASKRR